MKTEDIRMTEIALGPFSTLIIFSASGSVRAANDVRHPLVDEVPAFASLATSRKARSGLSRQMVLTQAV